jgi:hypothetical protein
MSFDLARIFGLNTDLLVQVKRQAGSLQSVLLLLEFGARRVESEGRLVLTQHLSPLAGPSFSPRGAANVVLQLSTRDCEALSETNS